MSWPVVRSHLREPILESMMLRLASESDINILLSLEEQCFESDKITREEFRKHLKNPRSRVVLEQESIEGGVTSDPRGYYISIYLPMSKRCRLYRAAVAPIFRRRGILHSFLRDFERDSLEKDFLELFLEVAKDNEDAISVYQKNGFVEYGVFPKYYENGKDALRMKKLLTKSSV